MPKSRETGPITIRAETGIAPGRRRGLRRQQRRRPDPVWAAQARARRSALRRPCSQRRVLGVAGGGKSTGIEPSLEWAGGNIWPDDLIVVLVAQFVIAKRLDHAAIGCELPLATADDP